MLCRMELDTARHRALDHLTSTFPGFERDFVIVEHATMDAGWCWVFFWNSRRFLETGALEDGIAGNAPIAVEKDSGRVHVTGTAMPVEVYLEQLRDRTICPVCGYDGLIEPPWTGASASEEICPACGIHFGYDDAAGGNAANRADTYERWRNHWVATGMKWFSSGRRPPRDWDPVQNLKRLQ
jgi:hypothetical protein